MKCQGVHTCGEVSRKKNSMGHRFRVMLLYTLCMINVLIWHLTNSLLSVAVESRGHASHCSLFPLL